MKHINSFCAVLFACFFGLFLVSCSSGDGDDGGGGQTPEGGEFVGEWCMYQAFQDSGGEHYSSWLVKNFLKINSDGSVEYSYENGKTYGAWTNDNGYLVITLDGKSVAYKFEIVDASKGMAKLVYSDKDGSGSFRLVKSSGGKYTEYAPESIYGSCLVFGDNAIQATNVATAETLILSGETSPQLQSVSWERLDLDKASLKIKYTDGSKKDILRTYVLSFDTPTEGSFEGNGESGRFSIGERVVPQNDFAPENLRYAEIKLGTSSVTIVKILFKDNHTVHTYDYFKYGSKNFRASYEKTGKNTARLSYSCDTNVGHTDETETLVFTSATGGTYANGNGTFTFKQMEEPKDWAPADLVGKTIKVGSFVVTCSSSGKCSVTSEMSSSKYSNCSYSYMRTSSTSAKFNLSYSHGSSTYSGKQYTMKLVLSFTSEGKGKFTGTSDNSFMPNPSGSFSIY